MKTIMLVILITFTHTLCYGITEYLPGDKLYIWAESGLNLREKPNIDAKVITKIAFGEAVICQESKSWYAYLNNSEKIIDRSKIDDGKTIEVEFKGKWVKVKFKNLEGYVFDAYLSRFEPDKNDDKSPDLFEFFKKRCDSIIFLEKKDSLSEYGRDKIVFSNGIYLTQIYSSGGFWFQMNIPDFSVEEAYLIVKHLMYEANDIHQNENGEIWISQDLGGFTIEGYKNFTIIKGDWSC